MTKFLPVLCHILLPFLSLTVRIILVAVAVCQLISLEHPIDWCLVMHGLY